MRPTGPDAVMASHVPKLAHTGQDVSRVAITANGQGLDTFEAAGSSNTPTTQT